MSRFQEYWKADKKRNVRGYSRTFLFWFRKCQYGFKLFRPFYRVMFLFIRKCHIMEIPREAKIGKGLYIGHPYNITINRKAVIGENCNIHKNATIGQENRGKRKGTPVIGNNVWIGINATIVGNVKIGDDVLIAPNSYVNFDVPAHSIVIGNPASIHHRDFATEGYINNVD